MKGVIEFFRTPGEIDLAAGLAALFLVCGIAGILNHIGFMGITGGPFIEQISLAIAIGSFGLAGFFLLVMLTSPKKS